MSCYHNRCWHPSMQVKIGLCFFKQKTSYEARISDGSSDVCSSDLVLREGAERIVPQGFPEVVDVDHKPPAVEETVDPVEHVHHERRANFGVVEKIGHVETDERRLQRQSVDLIVEHPAERTAPRPFLQPGTNAFRVALTEQLAQRENGPVLRREASKRGQPLVDHTLLCDAELEIGRGHV